MAAVASESVLDEKGLQNEKGEFTRPVSQFRNWISPDPDAEFPAEADRYVLYINRGCPWAHRANITRSLKRLDGVIQLVECGIRRTAENGWQFDGAAGTAAADPLYGFKDLGSLYRKANPAYTGRFTVPMLWDKRRETVVSNESSEVIRMLATAFDHLLPEPVREASKPLALRPAHLLAQIDELNARVYEDVNNGVYRAGFATKQDAYEEAVRRLFDTLDWLEERLRTQGTKYLFGEHITEADVRLYPTLIRFDAAYVTIFRCNLKQIRFDYPFLHDYLRRLYWEEDEETRGAFQSTTHFNEGYANASSKEGIVPLGPTINILPLAVKA